MPVGRRYYEKRSCGLAWSELFKEFRNSLVEVGHKPIVGHLEDRRIWIVINSYDDFRIFHARQVLYAARNTYSDIEVRGDHSTGLADLQLVWSDPTIYGSARGPYGSA